MSDLPLTWENFPAFFLRAFAGLFPLVNPFAVVPVFLDLTADGSPAERARTAARACLNAGVLMLAILALGEVCMRFLGVSFSAVRIAVGLIVAYMGFGMLFARTPSEIPAFIAAGGDGDHALIPLGFPGLSGAGALSMMIGIATFIGTYPSLEEQVVGNAVAVSAIIAVCLVSWAFFRIASLRARKTNRHRWEAMGRAMGILKVCIGIQLAINGIQGVLEASKLQQ